MSIKNDDQLMGYRDGISGKRLPQKNTELYLLGYRIGRNDRKGKVEPFQIEAIKQGKHLSFD